MTVVRDGNFIGVVAPHERAAKAAAAAMVVEWDRVAGQPSSETIYDHLKKTMRTGEGGNGRVTGDVARARTGAAHVVEASYHIPYIAHVPLEPRSAVAEWADGKVTVWCGTQRPFGVRSEVAQAFRLTDDQVRVIVPDMGSAYGGKHTGEHAIEAARLARAAGRPVKIVYTRAEEFMWGYLRPVGVIDVRASVDAQGRLSSWEFHNYNSGTAGLQTPYVVPNQHVQFYATDSPFRQGSYRGLAATANNYVREMHMDAIARAAGADAVAFRLAHIEDDRLRAVLTKAAEKSGWPKPSAPGRALGIACGVEKGSYIATAAELSKTPDGFRVERLTVVYECGAIVNPDGLRNQTEGAIVQGLGGALFEAIEFADGQISNGTMAEYRVPRFKDVPPIEIVLLDRRDLPSAGAGETPIICVAPAIGSRGASVRDGRAEATGHARPRLNPGNLGTPEPRNHYRSVKRHGDHHHNRNRLPIQPRRRVAPLRHGVDRGLVEQRAGLPDDDVLDDAPFVDRRLEHDLAFDMRDARDVRIHRRHVGEALGRTNVAADGYGSAWTSRRLGGGGFHDHGRRRERRA